ncbi:MAG: hypothetical protein HN757_18270, partial [Calditrichaeota bacterium]|nr:hypothetical protein [Calditrichota bacterium]
IEREVNVGEWFRDDDDKPVLIERWGQIASPFLGSVVGKTKQENGVWLLRSSYKKNKYEELFFVFLNKDLPRDKRLNVQLGIDSSQ